MFTVCTMPGCRRQLEGDEIDRGVCSQCRAKHLSRVSISKVRLSEPKPERERPVKPKE